MTSPINVSAGGSSVDGSPSIETPLTVAVLFGGRSPEYAVSLQSAAAVLRRLDTRRYRVVPVGIDREGRWYRCSAPPEEIERDEWLRKDTCLSVELPPDREIHGLVEPTGDGLRVLRLDAVFPVLHGENGEDGSVQGLLQLAGIPCVGCGTAASALCMDKDLSHRLARSAGIPVPDWVLFTRGDELQSLPSLTRELRYPLFVKPAAAGSSLGVTRLEDPSGLEAAVTLALRYGPRVVIEEGVEGREVGCAIIGNQRLLAGVVDEMAPGSRLLDYQWKYGPDAIEVRLPARVSEETAVHIKRTAARLYRLFGCTGLSRVDLFLTPGGELFFNEINTLPGLTAHSRFPRMMEAAGCSFEELLDRLIALAVEKEDERWKP